MKLVHPRANALSFEAVVVFTGSVTLILLGVPPAPSCSAPPEAF